MPDDLTQNSDREILLGSAGERDDQTRPMRTPRRTTLGPFRLEEKIGEGGMGIVYRAHDPQLDRWVAIKRIHSRYERDEAYNRLFLGEARAVASVSHPNIAQIYSIHPGEGSEPSFFAMEYVEGWSTENRVRRSGPLPVPVAVDIAIQAARGLRAAEKIGLVHRDVKPSNLLLDDRNRVKLVDFGLAIQVGELGETESEDDDQERIHCTPHYVSPEQARGWRVDHRSDIYSLGCTLYFLLTGREPFRSESKVDLFVAHANEIPTPPSAHRTGIPASLDTLVLEMLEKRAEDRPATYDALVEALERVLGEISPRPPGRRRRVAALLGISLLALGAIIIAQGTPRGEAESPFQPGQTFAGFYERVEDQERLHYDFTAPNARELHRSRFQAYEVDLERAGTVPPTIHRDSLVWRQYDQPIRLPYLSRFDAIELRGLLFLNPQHFRLRIGDDGTFENGDGIDLTLTVGGEPAHDRVVTHTFRGEAQGVTTDPTRLDFRVKSEEYTLRITREPGETPAMTNFRFVLAQEGAGGRESVQAEFSFPIPTDRVPRGAIVLSSHWPEENQNTVKIEQIEVRGLLDRARLAREQRLGAL